MFFPWQKYFLLFIIVLINGEQTNRPQTPFTALKKSSNIGWDGLYDFNVVYVSLSQGNSF